MEPNIPKNADAPVIIALDEGDNFITNTENFKFSQNAHFSKLSINADGDKEIKMNFHIVIIIFGVSTNTVQFKQQLIPLIDTNNLQDAEQWMLVILFFENIFQLCQ